LSLFHLATGESPSCKKHKKFINYFNKASFPYISSAERDIDGSGTNWVSRTGFGLVIQLRKSYSAQALAPDPEPDSPFPDSGQDLTVHNARQSSVYVIY
jgi:hypothetical protein